MVIRRDDVGVVAVAKEEASKRRDGCDGSMRLWPWGLTGDIGRRNEAAGDLDIEREYPHADTDRGGDPEALVVVPPAGNGKLVGDDAENVDDDRVDEDDADDADDVEGADNDVTINDEGADRKELELTIDSEDDEVGDKEGEAGIFPFIRVL